MNVSHGALERFSVCSPSAEVFFPLVDTNEETRINTEIDEFMSELNGEVVEMNLDARRILTTANAPPSRHKCALKQAEYMQWLEKEGADASQPNAMISYIMVLNNKHSPGSLWSTYSILRKWYKIEIIINIKDWVIVEGCAVDDGPKARLMGVGIGVSYFGLLHKSEILLVNVEDVTFNTEKNVYQ
eukprot:2820773-Ditylum_brightwellii.AAC.1